MNINTQKLKFCILLIFIIFSYAVKAQKFNIENYDVNIVVNSNGSFDVTEQLRVFFFEEQRGIIRGIPERHKVVDIGNFKKAKQTNKVSDYRNIRIYNLRTDDHKYTVYKEGNNKLIRIGQADKFIKGVQDYTIRYTVWGALNEFDSHVELSWNVIGNLWDVEIKNINYSIKLPKSISNPHDNTVIYTGKAGEREKNATIRYSGNKISGKSLAQFNPNEGITVAIKFPNGYFKNIFVPEEPYEIKNNNITAKFLKNGNIDITEKLSIEFYEAQTSFNYKIDNSYIINQHKIKSNFEKIDEFKVNIEYINVDEYEFDVINKLNFELLKIIPVNKSFIGRKTFTINYQIEKSLTVFPTHCQQYFRFNSINNSDKAKNISYKIELPSPIDIFNKNILVQQESATKKPIELPYKVSGQTIYGSITDTTTYQNFLSCMVRLPTNYFGNNLIISDYDTKIKFHNDGSFHVTESFNYKFNKNVNGLIVRKIPLKSINKHTGDSVKIEITDIKIENMVAKTVANNYVDIKSSQSLLQETGKVNNCNISYRVWGSIQKSENAQIFHRHLIDKSWRVFTKSVSYKLELLPDTKLNESNITLLKNKFKINNFSSVKQNNNTINGKITNVLASGSRIELDIKLPKKYFKSTHIPPFLTIADKFIITNFDTYIKIQDDGIVMVKNKYDVKFLSNNKSFSSNIIDTYRKNHSNYPHTNNEAPFYGILTNIYKANIFDVKVSDYQYQLNKYHNESNLIFNISNNTTDELTISYEYKIYDILKDVGDKYLLAYPIANLFNEPITRGKVRLELPSNDFNENDIEYKIFYSKDKLDNNDIPIIVRNGVITASLTKQNKNYTEPIIEVSFPKETVSKPIFRSLELFFTCNKTFIYPIFVFILLFIIWLFFGKDKKHTLVVQYTPPENFSPAEAGLLWDGKLHKRDLISLIYYWAGQGYIKIKQIHSDYELTKLKNLPKSSKFFEVMIFKALFLHKNTVSVNSFRSKYFYKTMKKAHRRLEFYGNQHKFFVPGTRGFGLFLKIVSFVVLFIGFFLLYDNYYQDGCQDGIVSIISAVIIFLFGKIMPNRGHLGNKMYAEILGFREFIEKAELDRLKTLINENPDYFNQTVAYAIVLGLGKQWAEKFDNLLTAPPSWYEGYSSKSFSSVEFTENIVKSMYKMNDDLNYKTPSPRSTRSYSSSSSSSSSSSFSSSSSWSSSSKSTSSYSSSGGSSFSSSGSSGSGFGGGGGSSW